MSSTVPSSVTSRTSQPNSGSLGPLTTAFSQPPSCADVYASFEKNLEVWVLVRDQICTDIGPVPDTACFPSTLTETLSSGMYYYFAGVACPVGYVQATSSLAPGKTTHWCCPADYKQTLGACFSGAQQQTTIRVHECNAISLKSPASYDLLVYTRSGSDLQYISFARDYGTISVSKLLSGEVNATVTAQQVVISLVENVASTTFSNNAGTQNNSGQLPSNRNPLGPGSIAAIVVTVVIAFAILIATVFCIWRHRNRKRKSGDMVGKTKKSDNGKGKETRIADNSNNDRETAELNDGNIANPGIVRYRDHEIYSTPEYESPRSLQGPSGTFGKDEKGDKSNMTELQTKATLDEMEHQISKSSEVPLEKKPHAAPPSTLPRSSTPPDPDEITTRPSSQFDTQATDGNEDTISDGDTQMGTPKTGEISETASIVIGNLPKPEATPRDDQIADLEYLLSELRRLRTLEEEQAKREAGGKQV